MLAIAQQKTDKAELCCGDAHALPYKNKFFNYVTSEFAFHHFEDKAMVLDEITRVLKKHSVFRMKNLEAFYSTGWWIYNYFPETRCEDYKRFWETDLIVYELENRGFSVEVTIEIYRKWLSISHIIKTARSRDISELNIITEEQYESGIKRIEKDINLDPDAGVMNEFALLNLVAHRAGV